MPGWESPATASRLHEAVEYLALGFATGRSRAELLPPNKEDTGQAREKSQSAGRPKARPATRRFSVFATPGKHNKTPIALIL